MTRQRYLWPVICDPRTDVGGPPAPALTPAAVKTDGSRVQQRVQLRLMQQFVTVASGT